MSNTLSVLVFVITLSFWGCTDDSTTSSDTPDTGSASAPDTGSASTSDSAKGADTGTAPKGKAPIFITTMTHLEGNWNYDGKQGRDKFDLDVTKIGVAMDTFDAHVALLTIESETPFSQAAIKWESDIFTKIQARGHGVGTHCDIDPKQDVIAVEEFAKQFTERKSLMDQLVGADNNLGCSGGQGRNEWIGGAHIAGFKYIDGVVGFGYLSMPLENRPEGWTDDYILKEGHFHDNIPIDLAERIHPFMMDDATDMVPDVPGKVLMSSGGIGRLDNMADTEKGAGCAPKCTLEDDDIEAGFRRIDEALAVHDPERVGKIDIYFPLSIFKAANLPRIETFLARLKTDYIDTGKLQWATQSQVYETYVSWNK